MRYLILLILALMPWVGAHAQSVAIMPVEAPDRQADGQRLFELLRAGLAPNGYQDKGEVSLSVPEARISFSCFEEEPACMAQVGRILEADELLWAKLAATGNDTVLTLSWVTVSTGEFKRPRATITLASGVRVAPYLDRAIPEFMAGKPLPQPVAAKSRITFVSEPSGAVVWLDEARMGKTPTTIELVRGTYNLQMRLKGHATQSKTLEVDGKKTLRFDMVPAAAVSGASKTEPASGGKSSWKLWTGAGALVGAVALTSLSVIKKGEGEDIASKARRTCPRTPEGECQATPEVNAQKADHESAVTTHVVSAIGAGVLAGAGAWLLVDYLLEDDAGVSVAPTLGGAALIGRF